MTRNSEVRLEDITGCDHTPETPIVDDDGEILYSLCRCGRKHYPKEDEPIHLATGIYVCGTPKSWCGAKFDIQDGHVKNGTQEKAKATCKACLRDVEDAEKKCAELVKR